MDNEARDELNAVIGRGLASYGETPARAGLEERVLARVRERGRRRWPAALVLCAAAVVAACLLFWWPSKVRDVPKFDTVALTIQATPLLERQLMPVSLQLPRRRKRAARSEPKLATFPTIAPLSGEERALARLVAEHPDRIPPELIEQSGPIKPIEISAIEIKPVQ